jgi:hypothetical protein
MFACVQPGKLSECRQLILYTWQSPKVALCSIADAFMLPQLMLPCQCTQWSVQSGRA